MLFVLIGIGLMAAALDRALRIGRVDLLMTGTRYELFALRDELRNYVHEQSLQYDDVFDYLDSTFSRTISHLDWASIWQVLAFKAVCRETEIEDAVAQQVKVSDLDHIYAHYLGIMNQFLESRHPLAVPVIRRVARQFKRLRRQRGTLPKTISVMPQTSTFDCFPGLVRSHADDTPSRDRELIAQ